MQESKETWWSWLLSFPIWVKSSSFDRPQESDEDRIFVRDQSPRFVRRTFSKTDIASSLVSTDSQDLFAKNVSELSLCFSSLPDSYFPRRRLHLPRLQKTLVLDLDETLVHSTSKSSRNYDAMIEVLVGKTSCLYYVFKRPFVDMFLKKVSEWYSIVIFTASLPEYADPVIDWLDASSLVLQRRLFRQSCIYRDGMYLKDLSLVEPNLGLVALIDNAPMSFLLNPGMDSSYV